VAAVKLVNLMQVFTSPRFLYAAEGNHAYVGLLLETFNNIIQYQYEGPSPLFSSPGLSSHPGRTGNVNLIYSVVRRKEIFERLAALTLPIAIKVKPAPLPCADLPDDDPGSGRPSEEGLSDAFDHRHTLLLSLPTTRGRGLDECS
jgi:hypothetical protein